MARGVGHEEVFDCGRRVWRAYRGQRHGGGHAGQSAYADEGAGPRSTWTGFYIGGGVGYGLSDAENSIVRDPTGVALTTSANAAGKGWLGTVTAGYDYQFSSSIVGGVFGDYIKGTLVTTSAINFFSVLGGPEKESSAWDVGARLGWLAAPTVLTYWTGGYTQARFDGITIADLSVAPGAFRAS